MAPLEPQEEEEEEENEAVAGDAFQLIPTSDLVHEGGPVDHGEEEKDEEEGISSTDEEPSVHEEVKPSAVIKVRNLLLRTLRADQGGKEGLI